VKRRKGEEKERRRAERRTGKEGKRGEGSGCKTVWRRPPTTSGMPQDAVGYSKPWT